MTEHTVAVVGGAGTIGTTAAYTLGVDRPDVDVRLCDVAGDDAAGHAIDLRHARCHTAHALGAPGPTGEVTAVDPGPDAVRGADCVLVTASVPRPTERGEEGRNAWWPANREVAETVGGWLAEADPVPVLSVTNPLDRYLAVLHAESGWPRHRFVGYSLSETARMADAIARHVGADPAAVDCPILGEHGEHMVPAYSRATVGGEPFDPSPAERESLLAETKAAPYDVIDLRGGEDSSRWVTARGVALVVERILDGGGEGTVCLSTPLDGEYGIEGVPVSVPVELGPEGVERVIEWELSPEERRGVARAAEAIRRDL
jgi:malate dehydrogenase